MNGPSLGQRIFFGPFGLRAGWRVALFLLVLILATIPLTPLAMALRRFVPFDASLLVRQASSLAAVFAATWALARLDKQPLTSYGLRGPNRARNLAAGAASGFAALSLLMGLLFAAGAAHFETPGLRGALPIAAWAVYWIALFVFVAFTEEMVTRGYPLFAASASMGFWPSAVLFSVLFGAGHLGNAGESYVGIANAMVAGLVFAYSLQWTGSLWWAIGCHLAWDWGQTFFFGVADSGVPSRHHLLSAGPAGPAWLSGGATGPEGSILALPVLLLLAVAVRITAPRFAAPGLARRRPPAAEPPEIPPPASAPSVSPSTYSVDSGDTN